MCSQPIPHCLIATSQVVTPPARSLGIFLLPPNTHNGEEIEILGDAYVVTCTCIMFKLAGGKYVRDHSRLDVQVSLGLRLL